MNKFIRKSAAFAVWFGCTMVLPHALRSAPQEALSRSGSLAGVVSDSSGAPLSGAEVRLRSSPNAARTTTDVNGTFRFDDLPAGIYELLIRFPGLIPVSQKVLLAARVSKPIQVSMSPDVLKQTMTVTEGRNESCQVATVTSATRFDAPIMDIPQSIQAVSKGVLQDRQITHVGDAAEVVSGVTRTIGFSDIADRYVVRGFLVDYSLKDGFKNNTFVTLTDVASVEHIEVFKGPSGILYGKIEPGGVVNVVTKRPLSDRHFALQSVFDEFGSVRSLIDLTGPTEQEQNGFRPIEGSLR